MFAGSAVPPSAKGDKNVIIKRVAYGRLSPSAGGWVGGGMTS